MEIKSDKALATELAQTISEKATTLSEGMNKVGASQENLPEESMLDAYGKMDALISRLGAELAADAARIGSIADEMEANIGQTA